MRKFVIVLGLGLVGLAAYTLGAKAGRHRYREIRAAVDAAWNDPRVRKARKKASKEFQKQTKKIGR